MESITQDIVAWLMDDEQISMEEALRSIYISETFSKLTNPDTGLYLDAPAAVYPIFRDEQMNSRNSSE